MLICAVVVLHGTVLVMVVDGAFEVGRLKFYTVLSNVLVAVGFVVMAALGGRRPVFRSYLFVAVLVSICVTGLVYNLVLVPFGGSPPIFSDYANFATHLLSMVLVLVNYFVFEKKGTFTFKHIIAAAVPAASYWAVFISIGGAIDFFPYFFMNVPDIGWGMAFAWFGIILAVVCGLTVGLVLFDKRMGGNLFGE